mgnify:CR=1 FL=1
MKGIKVSGGVSLLNAVIAKAVEVRGLEFGVWGLGFGVLRVWGLGLRV